MRVSLHSRPQRHLRLMSASVSLAAFVSLMPSAQAQNGPNTDEGQTTLYGRSVVVRAAHTSSSQQGWQAREEVSLGSATPDHHSRLVPVPPPSLPHARAPRSDVAAVSGMPANELWANYQPGGTACQSNSCGCQANSCGCQAGQHRGGKKPLKAVLGKLTAGFDLIIFGSTTNGGCAANGCDAGECDMSVCDSGGCDSMGNDYGLQPFASPHQHVHPHHHAPTVQPTLPPPSRQGQPTPVEHQPTMKRRAVPDERVDPFRDDPVSVSGRLKAKPASFRR